jgi:hypothetical protein
LLHGISQLSDSYRISIDLQCFLFCGIQSDHSDDKWETNSKKSNDSDWDLFFIGHLVGIATAKSHNASIEIGEDYFARKMAEKQNL